MSSTVTDPYPWVGVFVSPFILEHNDQDGHFYTSGVDMGIDRLGLRGQVQVYHYPPRVDDVLDPVTDEPIPGGKPLANVTLHVVHFQTQAHINDLDNEPDVWRLSGNMTEAQRTSVESALRQRGLDRIELTGAVTAEQMARRVAVLITQDPNFDGFPPGWFK